MKKQLGVIPKFISARDPKGLRRSMLKVQVQLGYAVNFFDIQFVKGKWYAWYEDQQVIDSNNVTEELGKDGSDNKE